MQLVKNISYSSIHMPKGNVFTMRPTNIITTITL